MPSKKSSHDSSLPAVAQNPRRQAHALLVRIEATQAFADRILDAALQKVQQSDQDKALVTELTYGTLRHQNALDRELNALLQKPISTLPGPVRAALRLGAYQLLMMRVPAYSAVNESVKLVGKKYGALLGVANGTLRALARKQDATPPVPTDSREAHEQQQLEGASAQAAHPPWMQQHIFAALGTNEGMALMRANMHKPTLSLRVNTTRTTVAALLQVLADHGVQAEISPYCNDSLLLPPSGQVLDLPGFAEGHWAVQDSAATLVGHLLAPPPGAMVLDLCAAPGGKAMHAACLMQNRGRVLACDVHPGRLRLIERNAARLGHTMVTALLADITTPEGAHRVHQHLQEQEGGRTVSTHVVLDAPCSALGTLRRHPELRRKDGSYVGELVQLQRRLLDGATAFVPEGGVLVYAVCTLTQDEGPEQVRTFLQRHQDFMLEAPPEGLAAISENNFLRTWPHRHGLDGFFAARLRRAATKLPRPAVIL